MKYKTNAIERLIGFISIIFIISLFLVSCKNPIESSNDEKDLPPKEAPEPKPQSPANEDLRAGGIDEEKNPKGEEENSLSEHFENQNCNRFYWTFKCALEFKISQVHSEECKSNIAVLYPNDDSRMERISAQSQNSQTVIKETWTNYFNKHCKDNLSVKEQLKNLD